MPATAVGNANGSSIIPSINRFPGNSYFTSTHAMISPNTTLINAAIKELPILVINAFLTVSFDMSVKNSFGDNFNA